MYKRSRVDAEIVLTLRRAEFLRAFLSASAQRQLQPASVQLWTAFISAYGHEQIIDQNQLRSQSQLWKVMVAVVVGAAVVVVVVVAVMIVLVAAC